MDKGISIFSAKDWFVDPAYVCPSCGSHFINIHQYKDNLKTILSEECSKCGYSKPVFELIKESQNA
jgi:hypothetical protein